MPVPDFQTLMLPALKALADGAATPISAIRERVADAEGLSPEDVQETPPSGRGTKLVTRVNWAVIDMERAGLLERVRRGVYRLLPEGERLLSRNPARVDVKLLEEYPSFVEWRKGWGQSSKGSRGKEADAGQGETTTGTPDEALDRVVQQLRKTLEAELLHRVRNGPPAFLERLVVDLLIAMGYGGGDAAKGLVTGRSGDGGIDGAIRQDALGLDEVYVQAKKSADDNTVGEGDLRNFAGAIDAAGTTKGVFVTTAGFTRAARDYVTRSPKRIVLIDGEELARLMVQHGIGVRLRAVHEVKRIDEDYFDQEAL